MPCPYTAKISPASCATVLHVLQHPSLTSENLPYYTWQEIGIAELLTDGWRQKERYYYLDSSPFSFFIIFVDDVSSFQSLAIMDLIVLE